MSEQTDHRSGRLIRHDGIACPLVTPACAAHKRQQRAVRRTQAWRRSILERCAATGAIRPRSASAPGGSRSCRRPARALGITRPLVITDPGLAQHAVGAAGAGIARAAGLPTGLFADVRPNPTAATSPRGVEALRAGGHDGVIALGGGSGLDAAKTIAFMVGAGPAALGFRGPRRQLAARQPGGARAGRGGADHRRHGLRGRARRGDHQRGQPREAHHLPPAHDAGPGDRRPRADPRPAAQSHRLDRDGCPLAQPGGVVRAGLPSAGRRHRDRGDPADPSLAGGRGRGRPGPAPPARTCWRRRAWARSPSRRGSAPCTRWPIRSAACWTATTA